MWFCHDKLPKIHNTSYKSHHKSMSKNKESSRSYTCNSLGLFFFMWVVSLPAWVLNTVFHFPVTSSIDALDSEDSVLILFILPTDVGKDFLVFLSSRLNVCKEKSVRKYQWTTDNQWTRDLCITRMWSTLVT